MNAAGIEYWSLIASALCRQHLCSVHQLIFTFRSAGSPLQRSEDYTVQCLRLPLAAPVILRRGLRLLASLLVLRRSIMSYHWMHQTRGCSPEPAMHAVVGPVYKHSWAKSYCGLETSHQLSWVCSVSAWTPLRFGTEGTLTTYQTTTDSTISNWRYMGHSTYVTVKKLAFVWELCIQNVFAFRDIWPAIPSKSNALEVRPIDQRKSKFSFMSEVKIDRSKTSMIALFLSEFCPSHRKKTN